ncbi:T9SS type A sorting domain-containing protein [Nonlabens marinus]|uniref:Secretion system C-terminal sorting domain-containing protein n=1 Tax=Nonlabens marinus S1-08 TaxID=1454201 RepID=W8VZU0_9FLAO|nr:T9SS type A sorting domain-containing protein [Nonlabens marinus]BAO55161.1 hypothetical protein NMS_1152 [Nonlabens marinus S1-08]
MKQIYTLFIFTLIALTNMNAQVAYIEDFSTPADGTGIEGSTGGTLVNIGDYPAGVDWTIDASAGELTANSDWAKTVGGLFSFRDTDGEVIWQSEAIDISVANGAFSFSVAASNNAGGFETGDLFNVYYSIDGGSYILVQDWNGLGSATATIIGEKGGNDWDTSSGAEIITVSGLTGTSTLQIRVGGSVNAGGEEFFFDDVTVFEGQPAPSLTITSPNNNEVLASGDFTASFTVNNFSVGNTGTDDGYVQYRLDSEAFTDKFDTNDISFSNVAAGSHALDIQLVDPAGAKLTPEVIQTINFEVAAQNTVANIAELRAITLPSTTVFTITGEVTVTHTESFRNQKWIEDATGAILIDDNAGVITTALTRGDRVSGITGSLTEFNGLLQLNPTEDPGAPTSSGNTVTPQSVSLNALALNPEDYESELVSVSMVSFTNADGTIVFENGADLAIDNGVELFTHRSFFGKDYIGEVVPTESGVLTGVVVQNNSRPEPYAISPRDANDIGALTLSITSLNKVEFTLFPNPATNSKLNINSSNGAEFDVEVFSTLGQRVITQKSVTNTINIDSLTTGLYIVKISQGDASQTRKLVVK